MPKSEVDAFLNDVGSKDTEVIKQDDPFEKTVSDPLAKDEGTKADGKSDDDGDSSDSDGKPLPYHKDPKLQRYIEKEISKRTKSAPPTASQPAPKATSDETDELTETLIEIIGNDTPQKASAVKKFRAQLGRLEERGAAKALEQIKAATAAEQAEEAQAREQLSSAFDSIEEEFDVDLTSNSSAARKERGEFIDFIRRVSPKDADGDVIQYPDIMETYKLYKSSQKPVVADNKRAKDLASRSMQRSSDATSIPPKGQTWKDVEKIFSKL